MNLIRHLRPGRAGPLRAALLALVCLLPTTCGVQSRELSKAGGPYEPPPFASGSDFEAIDQGELVLRDDIRIALSFERPGQAFGFGMSLGLADQLVVLTEGNPNLDTVLMIYGPDEGGGFFGPTPAAIDDDSGAGLLSRIGDRPPLAMGRYMVVVTTYDGDGRGEAILVVRRRSMLMPTCRSSADCDDGSICTDDHCDSVQGCVHVRRPACVSGPGDRDGDGVPEDGDESGREGDMPCVAGVTLGCDDNCPVVWNPLQGNLDLDPFGDLCDPDIDGDGDPNETDCAPYDWTIYHGAPEWCDGKDQDCDGETDEGVGAAGPAGVSCAGYDTDADGFADAEDNCPVQENEAQGDFDDDGVGDTCDPDADGDGFGEFSAAPPTDFGGEPAGGGDAGAIPGRGGAAEGKGRVRIRDCAPLDPEVNPGAPEICDGKDNDCDGDTDEGFADLDGDGAPDCPEAAPPAP